MSKSIRLSPKYGLNPSLMKCYYCMEDYGIAIPGLLKDDKQAPHEAVWETNPCGNCKEHMKRGVILISIRDGERPPPKGQTPNPYRTGSWCVVTDEAIERMFPEGMVRAVKTSRFAFVEDQAWRLLGLPRTVDSRISRPRTGGQ